MEAFGRMDVPGMANATCELQLVSLKTMAVCMSWFKVPILICYFHGSWLLELWDLDLACHLANGSFGVNWVSFINLCYPLPLEGAPEQSSETETLNSRELCPNATQIRKPHWSIKNTPKLQQVDGPGATRMTEMAWWVLENEFDLFQKQEK